MLNDDKIRLRPLEPEDLEFIYNVENDVSNWLVGNNNVPYSRYSIKHFIANTTNDIYIDKQLRLIVEDVETDESIGVVDLIDFSPINERAEVGIIINEEYREKGYGSSALSLLSDYAFERIGINMLYAYICCDNIASISLFEKSGFQQIVRIQSWIKGNKDAYLYQKLSPIKRCFNLK